MKNKFPNTKKNTLTALLVTIAISMSTAHAADPAPAKNIWSDTTSTAAVMGYCLANHPYRSIYRGTGDFTPEGFEIVSVPGVVGAVRRNFIWDRTTDAKDEGRDNSCPKACAEFGKQYNGLTGKSLHQKLHNGTVVTSGIGDIGSLVYKDVNFYDPLREKHISGVWSRGNTWHESDVAQSDYCCCQVTYK